MGYPPLVTPFSQYVKNAALMNLSQMIKGKERWSMLDENTWGMLVGKSGKLLGPLDEELLALAKAQNREFFTGKPQDLYPNELDLYKEKMAEKGWDHGQDDEELLEYAMHPAQYEAYKSGKAKESFLADLQKRREAKNAIVNTGAAAGPSQLDVEVGGVQYRVHIGYPGAAKDDSVKDNSTTGAVAVGDFSYIDTPLEGKFFLTKDSSEKGIKVGDKITKGQTVAYVEAMKVINAITSDKDGTVAEILFTSGDDVEEDDHIIKIA